MNLGTEQRKQAAIIPQGGTYLLGYNAPSTRDRDMYMTCQIRAAEILFGP